VEINVTNNSDENTIVRVKPYWNKVFLTMEPGQVIPGTDILFISIFINRLSACYTEFTSMPTFHIGPSVSEELPCKAKGFTSLVMEIR